MGQINCKHPDDNIKQLPQFGCPIECLVVVFSEKMNILPTLVLFMRLSEIWFVVFELLTFRRYQYEWFFVD